MQTHFKISVTSHHENKYIPVLSISLQWLGMHSLEMVYQGKD